MARLCVALLHHPVLHKDGSVISSAVTNTDIHDIARTCTTYDVAAYHVVTPIEAQRALVDRLIHHWRHGAGAARNPGRAHAFACVRCSPSLAQVLVAETQAGGGPVEAWATSARMLPGALAVPKARDLLDSLPGTVVMVLGTAYGLAPAALEQCQRTLAPLPGRPDTTGATYNHLSVRAAAAILLHHLRSPAL